MKQENPFSTRVPYQVWVVLIVLNIGLIFAVLNSEGFINKRPVSLQASDFPTATKAMPAITPTVTLSPSTGIDTLQPINKSNPKVDYQEENLFFLSLNTNGKYQIYAFSPGNLAFIKLFPNDFEEIHPAINSDNSKIAYSARKNGYWDLYIYDFVTNQEIRVTDSPEYEGHPSWSPDGQFLAYEIYHGGNFDIEIQPLDDLDQPPIRLTEGDQADFSPSWSPNGREIAFVSTRTGEEEIWVARLDSIDNRFTNISLDPIKSDLHPAWSPDGNTVIWSADSNGYPILKSFNRAYTNQIIETFSEGDYPYWVSDQVYYLQLNANQNFLTSRSTTVEAINLPSTLIPSIVNGFSLMQPNAISQQLIAELRKSNKVFKVFQALQNDPGSIHDHNLIKIEGIEAPYPYFIVDVSDEFSKLRTKTIELIGWDFLQNLDQAFVPITEPSNPGNENDWKFTGRAFEFNPLTVYADLAQVVKEERDGQTYWRIYLKTRYQDGSQGIPIQQMPWLLDSRYSKMAATYESGGSRTQIPSGYWVDFTALAQSFGWDRVAAISNWRAYFSSARFNQFVFTGGLDWYAAMNQIYPIEALRSPTPLPSITITPSLTPTIRYYRSPTATNIPTITPIPTRRPTWTPLPEG
ncbi:MAG: hypothetical protein BGO78_00480 [Chloroflexi bacterium 44-23]|nr:MAG: hypothetical protein BGO78_00480 [Chloroflexi bacterium 44-23]